MTLAGSFSCPSPHMLAERDHIFVPGSLLALGVVADDWGAVWSLCLTAGKRPRHSALRVQSVCMPLRVTCGQLLDSSLPEQKETKILKSQLLHPHSSSPFSRNFPLSPPSFVSLPY